MPSAPWRDIYRPQTDSASLQLGQKSEPRSVPAAPPGWEARCSCSLLKYPVHTNKRHHARLSLRPHWSPRTADVSRCLETELMRWWRSRILSPRIHLWMVSTQATFLPGKVGYKPDALLFSLRRDVSSHELFRPRAWLYFEKWWVTMRAQIRGVTLKY